MSGSRAIPVTAAIDEAANHRARNGFQATAQRFGLLHALFAAAMARIERWFGVRVFRVRARALVATLDLPPLPAGWSVRQVGYDEMVKLARADPELGIHVAFLASSAAHASTMTAVFDRQRVVAYAFATTDSAPAERDVDVRCAHPYRYSFKSFTHPDYRGRRLSAYTALAADAAYRTRGCTHSVSFTHVYNFASIRSEASKGNVRIGIAGYIKWGGWLFPFRSSGCRRAGFEFVAAECRRSRAIEEVRS